MVDTSFLPALSPFDVERAAELIQRAYAPPAPTTTPEDLKRLQHELFELQKRPEAWGLVIPLLDHHDQNVQFFGAHTAQVKIVRDWDSFPQEHAERLRDLVMQLTAHSMSTGRGKFILRKLFVAITSLALKLVPGHPSRWPDWIMACVTIFSGRGAPPEQIHDFLAIVAEEVVGADLLGPSKIQIQQSLTDAMPMVLQAIGSALKFPLQIPSALKCLQAWMGQIRGGDIIPLIPVLISLLDQFSTESEIFVAASDALQEVMSKSALSDGSGSRTLTEPLLLWVDSTGSRIVEASLSAGDVDEISHSFCKLLVALGDHSASYMASNISSTVPVALPAPSSLLSSPPKTKGYLTQAFLRILLAYTGLPGYYGVDEEESEMTLSFWYLFQEALWSNDAVESGDDNTPEPGAGQQNEQVAMAKAVYSELVQILRRKVAFPSKGSAWSKDQIDKFQVYRRDVGDTLINAYYVLREDMLGYYVDDVTQRLNSRQENDGWQDIEATLHCIVSIQEATDMEKSFHLLRLFSPETLGRLPSAGHNRIRRTMLTLIGTYSSWFATQSDPSNLLMNVVSYVVPALTDPLLCLQAAVALRNLCDANRKVLAPKIAAFAELHAGLGSIPDTEKSKVLQSIASVIQALPPGEEIPPIEAIVDPIVQKLAAALQPSTMLPDEARIIAIQQLETLSGVAKGLTRSTDGILILSEDDSETQAKLDEMTRAREDPRMVKLRDAIFLAVRGAVDRWSIDAEVSHALSDLFKSITCLPTDTTLITLPAGPLLELVCLASRRQLTAMWLSLAAILIGQLNPPPSILLSSNSATIKSGPTAEAQAVVGGALPILLECSLGMLGVPGAMENNPDVVQEFFVCMERVAQDFTGLFYHSLQPAALDALIHCAIAALALQERYSLVSACTFLSILIHRSSTNQILLAEKDRLMQAHGRSITKAVLEGFASVAPRSVVPNLIELLGTLLSRAGGGTGGGGGAGGSVAATWISEILFADNFVPSKATPEVKEKFIKAVLGSRSLKRTREAAQQFTLVARGLEGSGFGYTSVSM
ncbi:armadillo-type protein [Collybia nuda]|uniref:Armadillo-type protein n=1 Tax=Collybia nuda TaxID=64659 RepID=A0A9P6CCA0_9AGAR|nr:armadillo-type protein [Collybia nuda]